jgi:hypothetical protein
MWYRKLNYDRDFGVESQEKPLTGIVPIGQYPLTSSLGNRIA